MPDTFRLLIAGTSTFRNLDLLIERVDYYTSNITIPIEIVSGGQRSIIKRTGEMYGADFYAELYAYYRCLDIKIFEADWDKHGKPAGPIRNREMGVYVREAPKCAAILFWNGFSKGTRDMRDICKEFAIPFRLVMF